MKSKILLLIPLLVAAISLSTIAKTSHAISVIIEDNGADSQNQVNVNQQNNTTVNQNNSAEVDNDVDVNCDTGGNSASSNTGGSAGVNTGNCQASAKVKNKVNQNIANVSCPGCPTPKPSPTPPVKPSPSPTPPPGQPGDGKPGDGGGGGGGGGGNGGGGAAPGPPLAAAGFATSSLLSALGGLAILSGLWQSQRVAFGKSKRK